MTCVRLVGILICVSGAGVASAVAQEQLMGIGMVSPPIHDQQTLYFYGLPPDDPSASLPAPIDSLMIAPADVDILTAPPWFQPEMVKLDYDILILRAVSMRTHWIEVVVNRTTGQTAWVDRHTVGYADWTQFFIDVFAVEIMDPRSNPVRVRPFEHAGLVGEHAEPLCPMTIRGSWMQVALDMDGERTGWIKWRAGDRLLVTCSLLS